MLNILKHITKKIISFTYSLFYGSFGESSKIQYPKTLLRNRKCIFIGKNVFIRKYARIEPVMNWGEEKFQPSIKILDNVNIEQNVHITCAESVIIGRNVSILPGVLITDINHPYSDINIPPKIQSIEYLPVFVGDDSIIGMGARILPGVKIGKHCCIGTNAVVTKDVPDYSVAVGIPAKVIKTYSFEKQKWEIVKTKNTYRGGEGRKLN